MYVIFQPGHTGTAWQSEILYGEVEPGSQTLHLHWPKKAAEVTIVWRRRFYWEHVDETEVPLENGSGSGLGGRTVYNHDDGGTGHDNWVLIDGGDISGAIPAPCRMWLKNSYNVSARSYTVHRRALHALDRASHTRLN